MRHNMKLLIENWRKYLNEQPKEQPEYLPLTKQIAMSLQTLLTNEDPAHQAQGISLARDVPLAEYKEAQRRAVATVATSFYEILEIMPPNKLGRYTDERYYYDEEDKDRLSALREKAKALTTPEQLKVFIDEYLSFREDMKADYGFEDDDYLFPLDFMGHYPEDGIGAYPEMVKLVDMFGEGDRKGDYLDFAKSAFTNHYVVHELKAVLKNYLSK